jgi:excisionase family DNA binding protein
MEIKLTYNYVKREIDKLVDHEDKLERAIELLAECNTAEEEFNRNLIINKLTGRTISANSLKAKPYLESIIQSLTKVLEKPEQGKTYTVDSLAKHLNISKSSVYKLVEKDKIRYSKPSGKIVYFTQADVDEYIAKEKSSTQDDIKSEAMKHILFNKNKQRKIK